MLVNRAAAGVGLVPTNVGVDVPVVRVWTTGVWGKTARLKNAELARAALLSRVATTSWPVMGGRAGGVVPGGGVGGLGGMVSVNGVGGVELTLAEEATV